MQLTKRQRLHHASARPRGVLAPFTALLLSVALLGAPGVQATPAAAESGHDGNQHIAYDTPGDALDLEPLDAHPRTLLTIVEQLRQNHYVDRKLNDELSGEIFDNYLEMLDGNRMYFLASDVEELEAYRHELDDALVRGDLEPAFEIFNLYQQRLTERLEFLLSELDDGVADLDFSAEETMSTDRTDAPWPDTEKQLNDLWRKRLKGAALNLKLSGKPMEEVQELLTKRYKNRLNQAMQAKSEDAFQTYVNAFATTFDPHTQYFSPRTSENFNINMSLQLEGIGAVLSNEDDYTSVVELVPAGPADESGMLQPADRIVSVGQGDDGPLIDVVGWRLDDVVELIRGPKDSTVRLEIIPHTASDTTTRVITITRDAVELKDQEAQKKLLTLEADGESHRIGVIEIPTFYADFEAMQNGDPNYKSTTRDVRRLIEELKAEDVDALVVDLRNNGGGSLQEADTMTGLFIESGPTVQVKSADRRPSIYTDSDDSVAWEGPMAVLVNRLSASASEIFAGAIQDYGRGIIVGSRTFGKGTVQTLVPLNRGQLKLTAAKFYRVSGQSTQHQGIIPDIEFPEIYNADQIGESSLDDALPWDMIKPAAYPRSEKIHPLLAELNDRHRQRVTDDPDFKYMRALARKNAADAEQDRVSLNESEREAEKAQEETWRLELENALRAAKGEEPLESLEAFDELALQRDDDEDDPHEDAMVRESGRILVDYISLSRQVALAGSLSESGDEAVR